MPVLPFEYPVRRYTAWPRTERGRTATYGSRSNVAALPFAERYYLRFPTANMPPGFPPTGGWLNDLVLSAVARWTAADLADAPIILSLDVASTPDSARWVSEEWGADYRISVKFDDFDPLPGVGVRRWRETLRFDGEAGGVNYFLQVATVDPQPWPTISSSSHRDERQTGLQANPYLMPSMWPGQLLAGLLEIDAFGTKNWFGDLDWSTNDGNLPTEADVNADPVAPGFTFQLGAISVSGSDGDCP